MSQNCYCNMNEYLKTTHEKLRSADFSALHVVLGNESCDLDSAACALAYAAFLHWQHAQMQCKVCTRSKRPEPVKDDLFVPLLNVDREDYELKTEVVHCLEQLGIHKDHLFFKDDPEVQARLPQAELTLVDHHVLAAQDAHLAPLVTEIIDHRPLDKAHWRYRADARSTVELVGSCATLVAQRVLDLSALFAKDVDFFTAHPDCCDMLHSTIILDTVNFSKELDKGTPHDEEVVRVLEGILAPADCQEERARKLRTLVAARGAGRALGAGGLLRKDAKLVGDVLVPSLPLLVHEFLARPDALPAVVEALGRRGAGAGLLLGMRLDGGLRRDAAVYCADCARRDRLCSFLLAWRPALELSEDSSAAPSADRSEEQSADRSADQSAERSLRYFRQLNLSASRKQYMPALQAFLATE